VLVHSASDSSDPGFGGGIQGELNESFRQRGVRDQHVVLGVGIAVDVQESHWFSDLGSRCFLDYDVETLARQVSWWVNRE